MNPAGHVTISDHLKSVNAYGKPLYAARNAGPVAEGEVPTSRPFYGPRRGALLGYVDVLGGSNAVSKRERLPEAVPAGTSVTS